LSNAELLAILIRTGTRTETALDVSYRLLKMGDGDRVRHGSGACRPRAGGLRYLVSASAEELRRIRGVGPAKAAQLKAALELGKRVAVETGERPFVRSPEDVSALVMESMRYLEREHFKTLLLDSKNRLMGVTLVSIGNLDSSIVHPREIFKEPIRRAAAAVVLVHNHPSGDPEPSAEDLTVTRRLIEAGSLLGIEVLDHVIIGDNRYVSLRCRDLGWSDLPRAAPAVRMPRRHTQD